jgi:hypothetical protein
MTIDSYEVKIELQKKHKESKDAFQIVRGDTRIIKDSSRNLKRDELISKFAGFTYFAGSFTKQMQTLLNEEGEKTHEMAVQSNSRSLPLTPSFFCRLH